MNRYRLIPPILALFCLTFCSKEPQPGRSEIEQALTTRIPAFARVSSFSVEAMQNMGTKVEPLWHARFRATITVASPTFASDGTDPSVTFVRAVKLKGDSIEVFGKSASTLYGGAWRTSIELEGQPLGALGLPEDAFGSGKVIVRGTKEESAYLSEQTEKRRMEAIAAARQAEEQRLATERANEARRRMLASASRLLVGTWRDENSLTTYAQDGSLSGTYQNDTMVRGSWAIEGDTVITRTLERAGKPVTPFMHRYEIIELTAESFVLRSDSGKIYNATRVK